LDGSISERRVHPESFKEVFTYSALNDTLFPQLTWLHLPNANGDITRLSLACDLPDAVTFTAGVVVYEANREDATYCQFRQSDRAFLEFLYHFQTGNSGGFS